MPNEQAVTHLLTLNKYTYCHNNPTLYNDSTGHVPFLAITGIVGTIAGILAEYRQPLKVIFHGIQLQGAVVGGMISLTGGAVLAYGVTSSVLASTGAVATDFGFGVSPAGHGSNYKSLGLFVVNFTVKIASW